MNLVFTEQNIKELIQKHIKEKMGADVDMRSFKWDCVGGHTVYGQFDVETSMPAQFNGVTVKLKDHE